MKVVDENSVPESVAKETKESAAAAAAEECSVVDEVTVTESVMKESVVEEVGNIEDANCNDGNTTLEVNHYNP